MNLREDIQSFFDDCIDQPILIIGDVMIDRYLWGSVDRISPEAPVPIVEIADRESRLGGAANVALNIKAMGAKPLLCALVGRDEAADTFAQRMQANEMDTAGLVQSSDRRTTVKTRILCRSQQMLRFDEENKHSIKKQELEDLLGSIRKMVEKEKPRVAILQDYNKGTFSRESIAAIIEELHSTGIAVCVDPKRQHFLDYKKVSLFKPNLRELRDTFPNLELDASLPKLEEATSALRKQLENEITLITLSDEGVYVHAEGAAQTWPAHKRNISDVSGAGDTVISLAALGLASKAPTEIWVQIANLAGGLVCEYVGVVPVIRQQLMLEAARVFN